MADINAGTLPEPVPCNVPLPEPSRNQCRYCLQPININAKVCQHCSRHQNRFIQYLDRVGLAVSIIMVLIAFSQLREARQERVDASAALAKAREVEQKTEALHESFRQQALLLTRITWLSLETKYEFGGERARKAAEQVLKYINLVLRSALPDEKQRAQWIAELKETIPEKK